MPGCILNVTHAPAAGLLLRSKLRSAHFDVITAHSGAEALSFSTTEQPDLVLIDSELTDTDAKDLCAKLKSEPQTEHIPVVIQTPANCALSRIKSIEANADDFISKSCSDRALLARLRNLLRMKLMFDELRLRDETVEDLGLCEFKASDNDVGEAEPWIVVSAYELGSGLELLRILDESLDLGATLAQSVREIVQFAEFKKPDLILLGQEIADGSSGLSAISDLRAHPATGQAAIIYVCDAENEGDAARALDLGATEFLIKPYDIYEMKARIRSQVKRKRYSDRLRANLMNGLKQAVIDPLTGLYNRRYALRHIERLFARSRESDSCLAVMMLDLDKFKSVNDEFGHEAGDLVLAEFARRLQTNLRGVDLVARLGGEEFCVALPDTDTSEARQVAERLRSAIEDIAFELPEHKGLLNVTVSIGVAVSDEGSSTVEDALRRADLALYASKHRGRNCVSFFQKAA